MPRSPNLTPDQIESAIAALSTTGQRISCRTVHNITGGSMATVAAELRRLRATGHIAWSAACPTNSVADWISTVSTLLASAGIQIPPLPKAAGDEWFVVLGVDEAEDQSISINHPSVTPADSAIRPSSSPDRVPCEAPESVVEGVVSEKSEVLVSSKSNGWTRRLSPTAGEDRGNKSENKKILRCGWEMAKARGKNGNISRGISVGVEP